LSLRLTKLLDAIGTLGTTVCGVVPAYGWRGGQQNHRLTWRAVLASAVIAFVEAVKCAFPFFGGCLW